MTAPRAKKGKAPVVPQAIEEERLNIEAVTWEGLTWVNVQQPTRRETDFLAQHYAFNQLDLDDCVSRRQRPKIDEYEDYLFLVLHFPKWHKDVQISRPSQVGMFIGRDYVVTVHAGELTPLVRFFGACKDNEAARKREMSRSAAFFAYRIIDLLVDYCFPIMDKILTQMDSIEDKVFDQNFEVVHELAVVRRDIIAQRRIIWPLRAVIIELETKLRKFTDMDMSDYFGDLLDHVNKLWDTLDECKETIEVYKDSDYVLSTDRINRIMQMLTVFSAIILPFLVISGIYGMNVNLPGGLADGSLGPFLILLLVMLLVSAGMLYFFYRKRWIK
jgi:magnesium transporter